MKKPKESDLVRQILRLLDLRGVLAWRNNTTGVFDPARKCFRSFHGLRGVSDVLAVFPPIPPSEGGKLLAIEAKTKTGRVSPEQAAFLAAVRENGGIGLVVRDVSELDAFLRERGVGL